MQVHRCFGCMAELSDYPCTHCGFDPNQYRAPDYALRQGTILRGKYLIGRVLGQGGFGITYVGWDLALERKVAIKEYFPSGQVSRYPGTAVLQWFTTEQSHAARENGMEVFLREARKMSRADTIPSVAGVHDLFQENETAYIVMDFIEGETLKHRLEQTGPLRWEDAKQIFLPVIEAMEKVHQAGLIHRDISPDNLMLEPEGGVRILDLGAAKDLKVNSGASSMMVAKGGFSPLEQYVQQGSSGTWTDVYALAATMYYTLTGTVPPTAVDRLNKDCLDWELPQLRALPAQVLSALKRAMALRAEDRTQTMAEFRRELETAVKPAKPRRRLWIPAAVLALAAVTALLLPGRTGRPEGEMKAETQTEAETEIAFTINGEARDVDAYLSYREENGEITITGVKDGVTLEGDVGLPNHIMDKPVTAIGEKAFYDCRGLTGVTIPNGVTSIGFSAFYYCRNLTDVTMPNSITSIEDSTFSLCSRLTKVTIPNSITSIGNNVFSGCSSLTKITIPDSVTSIGNYAFSRCSSLTEVTIPSSVTSIGNYTFSGCSSLIKITIPSSVTSIGNYTFSGCSNLTKITIPNSVISIGDYVFSGCGSLTKVTISNSVTSIGKYAFSRCSSLTEVTIPNSVTFIGYYAFTGCSNLTKVIIPNSVTFIGYYAFSHCNSLVEVTIPNSVTFIGECAFSYCSKLTEVTIPDSVTSIGKSAFSHCSRLNEVTIPDSVTSIEFRAFSDCNSLTQVTIPSQCKLGFDVFDDSCTVIRR